MAAILQYHQIADVSAKRDPKGLAVSPRIFERQMAYLHRAGFRCLPLLDVIAAPHAESQLPPRSFAITFDDGFRDVHDTVWPILERFEFTATVFLVVGRMGMTSDWDGEESAAPLLSWTDALALSRAGLTFGSHTITHPWLTALDDQAARHEIGQSRMAIHDRLGTPAEVFAYPYSARDQRIQRITAETGYVAACGGERGFWDRYNVWRTQCVGGDSFLAFRLKASGLYSRWTWLREQSLLAQVRFLLRPRGTGTVKHEGSSV